MVRFKNRYLLVEFLSPANYQSTISSSPNKNTNLTAAPGHGFDDLDEADDDDEGDDELIAIAPTSLPFLLPTSLPTVRHGEEGAGASAVYKAVRVIVQEVFGDEGWGRLASSFKVIYHSPLTTLTFLRIARAHYRLLWSALTFLTTIDGRPVIPRVLAVSGTIKKLQNRGTAYHRAMVAQVLAHAVDSAEVTRREGVRKEGEREREEMGRVLD